MKAVRELKRELPSLYKREQIEPRDIIFILGKVREILENKGEYKEEYPELNLFCNWCLHTGLSRSKTIYRALLNVSKAISSATNVPPDGNPQELTNVFLDTGSNVLNIPRFRLGLKHVLNEQGIDTIITDRKNWWDSFIKLLLHEISEKPLEFPADVIEGIDTKSQAYQFYKQVLELPNALNHDKIICLRVMNDEGKFENKNGSIFTLQFTTLSGVHFVVELRGKENESAFSS